MFRLSINSRSRRSTEEQNIYFRSNSRLTKIVDIGKFPCSRSEWPHLTRIKLIGRIFAPRHRGHIHVEKNRRKNKPKHIRHSRHATEKLKIVQQSSSFLFPVLLVSKHCDVCACFLQLRYNIYTYFISKCCTDRVN